MVAAALAVVVMVVSAFVVIVVIIIVVMVAAALAVVVMVVSAFVVIVVIIIVVMVAAALAIVVMVMVPVLVDRTLIVIVMVMVVMVVEGLGVDLIVETRIVYRMHHLVGEFVLVHIEDRTHEVEFHMIRTGERAVVLDPVVHVDEVESDSVPFLGVHGGLDVPEKASGLALHVFSDGHEGVRELHLRVGVEILDGSGESGGASARLLDGGVLVLLLFVVVMAAAVAHCIIP